MQFLSPRTCNFKIARVNHSVISARFSAISPRYRGDIAAIFDKVESQGPLGRIFHTGFQFVLLWLIQTQRTSVRLCLRLRRAPLGTVLAIHKQAAATAKSSSIFMLVYRYIFRVVSKSKPKKSKLTNKRSSRNKGTRLFCKQSVYTCEIANLLLKVSWVASQIALYRGDIAAISH